MSLPRVVFRADDAGASSGANSAVRRAAGAGAVRNVSLLVVGPAFEALAAEGPFPAGVDVGLHTAVNSEWDSLRWGPLVAAPSLVREDGSFWPTPAETAAAGFDPEEVMAEVAAQLARLRGAGFRPAYLDEHMCWAWFLGMEDRLGEFAAREGLVYRPHLPEWRGEAEGGPFLALFHPMDPDEVSPLWTINGSPRGKVARERQDEARVLTAPAVGAISVTYSEIGSRLSG